MAIEIPTDTIIDKVFAGFKKITPALVAVSLVAGAILFLPKSILELLGLNELPGNMRTIIGLVFLLSVALIATIAISYCWKTMTQKYKYSRTLKNLRNSFIALAPEPKKIVLKLLKSKEKHIVLDIASGNTIYLQDNNFIYRPEQMIIPGYDDVICAKFIPHPWLIDLYNKEPELFL